MSSMMISLTMFLLIIGVTVAAPSEIPIARVLTPPCSKNVTLNHEVSLNCTAVASHIGWEIVEQNSQRFIYPNSSQYVTVDAAKHIIKRSLTMIASTHENNATVRCIAISSTGQNKSDWARILVQGPLKKVSNLTVSLINSTTVLISWSPPFTLEGVPILGYNVTITNTTSGENETMLAKNYNLLYYIDYPDPEDNFTVTVVPINEVGAGQSRSMMVQFLIPAIQPARPSKSLCSSPWESSLSSLMSKNKILFSHTTSLAVDYSTLKPLPPENLDERVIIGIVIPMIIICLLLVILAIVAFTVWQLRKVRSKHQHAQRLESSTVGLQECIEQQDSNDANEQEGQKDTNRKQESDENVNGQEEYEETDGQQENEYANRRLEYEPLLPAAVESSEDKQEQTPHDHQSDPLLTSDHSDHAQGFESSTVGLQEYNKQHEYEPLLPAAAVESSLPISMRIKLPGDKNNQHVQSGKLKMELPFYKLLKRLKSDGAQPDN